MLKGINTKILRALAGTVIDKKVVEYHDEQYDNSFNSHKAITVQPQSMSKVKKVDGNIMDDYNNTYPLGVGVTDKLNNHVYLGESVY